MSETYAAIIELSSKLSFEKKMCENETKKTCEKRWEKERFEIERNSLQHYENAW